MTKKENYYTLLELDHKCTKSDIDNAYRRLAVRWHPDKNKDNKENAEKKFREISKAYQVLSDDTARSNYDKHGVTTTGNNDNLIDPYEMFKGIFETEDNQIPDVIIKIEADITQLYTGFTETVKFTRFSPCNKCDSTGAQNRKSADCTYCAGRGILLETIEGGKMGFVINEKSCEVCEGRGIDPDVKLCKKCSGVKYIKDEIECEVDVPPGAYDNYYIKLKEEGNYIPLEDRKTDKANKIRTDVIVVIKEKNSSSSDKGKGKGKESVFRRGMFIQEINRINLADILMTVNISFGESIVGVKKEIDFLAGEIIGIDIDEIIHNGDIHVIKGMGMPLVPEELEKVKMVTSKITSKSVKPQTRGDLFLHFKVEKPVLSKQKRNRLWQVITDTPYPDEVDIDDIYSTQPLDSYINDHKLQEKARLSISSDSSIEDIDSDNDTDVDNDNSFSDSESSHKKISKITSKKTSKIASKNKSKLNNTR